MIHEMSNCIINFKRKKKKTQAGKGMTVARITPYRCL